jgi:trans-aconitate methyltransferase
MCWPGYLLGEIHESRSDIILEGVDSSEEFINNAIAQYPSIIFHLADVLTWESVKKYDMILVTWWVHHLPYELQESFIARVPYLLNENGIVIFADPYIGNYANEQDRQASAAKLWYEYLLATIQNNAPIEIVKAAIDILHCDVTWQEYKTSIAKLAPVFNKHFKEVTINKTRPSEESEYGDYYIVCGK